MNVEEFLLNKDEIEIDYILKLYNIKRVANLSSKIENTPINGYVQNFGKVPTILLANKIGMIIPPGFAPDKYYKENILYYNRILTRSPDLKLNIINPSSDQMDQYTDAELLLTDKGVYFLYTSRYNLVLELNFAFYTGTIFYYPLTSGWCSKRKNFKGILINMVDFDTTKGECFTLDEFIDFLKIIGKPPLYQEFIYNNNTYELTEKNITNLLDLLNRLTYMKDNTIKTNDKLRTNSNMLKLNYEEELS